MAKAKAKRIAKAAPRAKGISEARRRASLARDALYELGELMGPKWTVPMRRAWDRVALHLARIMGEDS